jgi:hypothetical protein
LSFNITCLAISISLLSSLSCLPALTAAYYHHYAYTNPLPPPRHTQPPYALLRHPLSQDTRIARPEALADRATARVPACTR